MSKKFKIVVDGIEHIVDVAELGENQVGNTNINTNAMTTPSSSGGNVVCSPLQGTVQTIKVKQGQNVNEGDVVVIIEAMKMENDVPSTFTGVVKNILVSEGQKVESGQPLIEF